MAELAIDAGLVRVDAEEGSADAHLDSTGVQPVDGAELMPLARFGIDEHIIQLVNVDLPDEELLPPPLPNYDHVKAPPFGMLGGMHLMHVDMDAHFPIDAFPPVRHLPPPKPAESGSESGSSSEGAEKARRRVAPVDHALLRAILKSDVVSASDTDSSIERAVIAARGICVPNARKSAGSPCRVRSPELLDGFRAKGKPRAMSASRSDSSSDSSTGSSEVEKVKPPARVGRHAMRAVSRSPPRRIIRSRSRNRRRSPSSSSRESGASSDPWLKGLKPKPPAFKPRAARSDSDTDTSSTASPFSVESPRYAPRRDIHRRVRADSSGGSKDDNQKPAPLSRRKADRAAVPTKEDDNSDMSCGDLPGDVEMGSNP